MKELNPISFLSVCIYLFFSLIYPIIVRAIICLLDCYRIKDISKFCTIFSGRPVELGWYRELPGDHLLPLLLGVLEMLAYPLLMVAGHELAIGFWLTFKTIHRWGYAPKFSRGPYNRYLLGNAAILIGAYLSAQWAVGP